MTVEFLGAGLEFALALAVAGAAAFHLGRSPAPRYLLGLRAAAAAMVALALVQPVFVFRRAALEKPKLSIVVDVGQPMGGAEDLGAKGSGPRLKAAAAWLEKNRAALTARAEVSLYAAAGRARPVAWEDLGALSAEPEGFDAAAVLDDLADEKADRMLLVTDGNAEHAPEALAAALRRWNTPIDLLGVGPARRGVGAGFVDIKTPDFVFLHNRFPVTASIEASGLAGERLRLRLSKAAGQGWQTLSEQELRVAGDEAVATSSFTAAAEGLGRERYRLEILRGQKTQSAREFGVEVIRQKYRIMYLAGRPSWEYAALREFLKSNPNHELVSFVILRNPENVSMVPDTELSLIPFPAEEIFVQSLGQFDLFILENFSARKFNLPAHYLAGLKGFVANGGALLVIGGENAFGVGGYKGTPLEEILPVTLSGANQDYFPGLFKPELSSLSHPLLRVFESPEETAAAWAALPPLDGFARFAATRPGAAVLASHPREKTESGSALPIVALRDVGRGKVMLVASDSTWRWKLGAARDLRASAFYGRFWTRAVQYLTGSLDLSKVKFAPIPDRIPPREPAAFSLRVFDENFRPAAAGLVEVTAQWTGPDGVARPAAARESGPGFFAIELTGLAPGAQTVKASVRYGGKPWGSDAIRFVWEPVVALPMNRAWLQGLADATGGVLAGIKTAEAGQLLERLPPVRKRAQVRSRRAPGAAAGWLWIAAALFIAEWGLRRRLGYA